MAFDIDRYARTAAPVDVSDLDLGAFRDRPLSQAALRTLRFMTDIESHTVCYLRDLLVTPSHQDPEVTTFLTMWNYEEHWHGEVLGRVLEAHGEPPAQERTRRLRSRLGRADRLAPIRQALLANLVGEDFVAVHMTWGAVNEWATHAGYRRLVELEGHPTLTAILQRIMRQETRHVAFYATQARDRLARSARARRLTRFALTRFWAPVGSAVMPREETRHLLHHLLGGPGGAAAIAKIDGDVHRLPGLDGIGIVRRAAAEYGVAA
jgi:hypothetical protein